MAMFIILIMVMVSHVYMCAKIDQNAHFNSLQFILFLWYLTSAIKTKRGVWDTCPTQRSQSLWAKVGFYLWNGDGNCIQLSKNSFEGHLYNPKAATLKKLS